MKALLTIFGIGLAAAQTTESLRTYGDPLGRFQFDYPAQFGPPSPGTDNGFGNRVAAVRFSDFSAGVRGARIILGGEAVLTTGPPQLDLQAAGGLYDGITLQIFPAPAAALIRGALPILTPAVFCDAIRRESHLDPADPRLSPLTIPQRASLPAVDRMGNIAPKLVRCEVAGDTITFHKESAVDGGSTRHVYGAIRFLSPPYSSFQIIRGGADPPEADLLQQITNTVKSWIGK